MARAKAPMSRMANVSSSACIEVRNTFRTMVLARRRHGDEAVNKLYEAFGTLKHEEKK